MPDPIAVAELVAAAVLAHPAVARLDGGLFGGVATVGPSGQVSGVRIGEVGEPVELVVVLHLDVPIPDVVRGLRGLVAQHCPDVSIDITVADVVDDVVDGVTGDGADGVAGDGAAATAEPSAVR